MTSTVVTDEGLFGRNFWRKTLDRFVKTFFQALIVVWPVGDSIFHWWAADGTKALGAALAAAVLSLITSIASAPVGPVDSPSTI